VPIALQMSNFTRRIAFKGSAAISADGTCHVVSKHSLPNTSMSARPGLSLRNTNALLRSEGTTTSSDNRSAHPSNCCFPQPDIALDRGCCSSRTRRAEHWKIGFALQADFDWEGPQGMKILIQLIDASLTTAGVW
jgi:hypothetical protein